MIASRSWQRDHVVAGESVGMCMRPTATPEAYATCWVYTMNEAGEYDAAKSFLVAPENFTAEMRLEDQEGLGVVEVPLMFGSWQCTEPIEVLGRVGATCGRILPKDANLEDTTYKADQEITIMTYLTSKQTGRVSGPEYVNGNLGLITQNDTFENLTLDLADAFGQLFGGATHLYSGMAGLAFALFSVSF